MARNENGEGHKGSLKWIQKLVNDHPQILEQELRICFSLPSKIGFRWTSPLREKNFKEYRDEDFLEAIDRSDLKEKLKKFWPKGGPQWDALGVLSDGTALLIEAKAHISEVESHMKAENPDSIRKIKDAFERTKQDLGVRSDNPWTSSYYQYANRVAHLHFLRNMNNLPAYLIFVNFIGDDEVGGPSSAEEWRDVTESIHAYLGIGHINLLQNIADVCIDIKQLEQERTEKEATNASSNT